MTVKPMVSNGLFYLLGLIGLAAIGLIPLRSLQIIKRISRWDLQKIPAKLFFFVGILSVFVILFVDVEISKRIVRCLTDDYCGPSTGSLWVYLAMLGTAYVIFEFIHLAIQLTSARYVKQTIKGPR